MVERLREAGAVVSAVPGLEMLTPNHDFARSRKVELIAEDNGVFQSVTNDKLPNLRQDSTDRAGPGEESDPKS